MIIQCQSCSRKFIVKDIDIPEDGRTVQCGYCSVTWHQMPESSSIRTVEKPKKTGPVTETDESPSIDSIQASDGKTYKFLGNQWAQILPSGKTGLFARKKISQELDEMTGRKEKRVTKKRQKKIKEVEIDSIEKIIDPSSGNLDNEEELAEISESKQGLGFFGYIFLLIIVGFSIVGILRTFENDLLNYFPEIEIVYRLLDEQLEHLAETVKNMIVIIKDLMNSY